MSNSTGTCPDCDQSSYQYGEYQSSDPETGWTYTVHMMKCGNCGHEYEAYDNSVAPLQKGLK